MFSTQAPVPELISRILIDMSCYAVLELTFRTYVYGTSERTIDRYRESTVGSVFQEFMCFVLLTHYLVTGASTYAIMNHFMPVMIAYYIYDTVMAVFIRERFLTRQALFAKVVHHLISIVALTYLYYQPAYLHYIVYYCVIEALALILAVRLYVNWSNPAWLTRLSLAYLVADFVVRVGIMAVATHQLWSSAPILIAVAWTLMSVMMFNNIHAFILSRRRERG